MDYLINPICKFTPLFVLNTTRKKAIMAATLFKTDKAYNKFGYYLHGTVKASDYIMKKAPMFIIRLFIDKKVYQDKYSMDILKKLKNVELVLCHCNPFLDKKGYHIGFFGTMFRLFPMFDFPNNDAFIVSSIDIDVLIDGLQYIKVTLDMLTCLFETMYNKEIEKICLMSFMYTSMFKKTEVINYKGEEKFKLYFGAGYLLNIKKMNPYFLVSFLQWTLKERPQLTMYNDDTRGRIDWKDKDNFMIFGVDEYFLNKYLVPELLKSNEIFGTFYKFRVTNLLTLGALEEESIQKYITLLGTSDKEINTINAKIATNKDLNFLERELIKRIFELGKHLSLDKNELNPTFAKIFTHKDFFYKVYVKRFFMFNAPDTEC
jgi:hypothetical protein